MCWLATTDFQENAFGTPIIILPSSFSKPPTVSKNFPGWFMCFQNIAYQNQVEFLLECNVLSIHETNIIYIVLLQDIYPI